MVLLLFKQLIVGQMEGNLSHARLEEFGHGMVRVNRFIRTRIGHGRDVKTLESAMKCTLGTELRD